MRFRKLRIAWSIGCGIAAALLIVLWLSSYWHWHSLRFFVTNDDWFVWCYEDGEMALVYNNSPDLPLFMDRRWQFDSFPSRTPNTQMPLNAKLAPFFFYRSAGEFSIAMPTWALVVGVSVISGLPWLRRARFSLRTLLIATTLVAVVLGLIVYAARQ